MYDWVVLWEWAEIGVRWLHVITAIAWIGSSFYFIALDLGLRKAPDLPPGAHGEEWQVHGGGFYHIRKYLVAPEAMPEHLTWFKWESYATWLSGFALLALVYYLGAEMYLIDPNVMELQVWQAIGISLFSLAFGWLVYDTLCKTFVNADQTVLMAALFVVLVGMAWGYTQVFSGRAALLHLGAFTATIMSANVFMVIMPNQRIVVADLQAGRRPDPKYGKIAKQRSTHNNYLTLPVLFLMLSNHYPLVFATQWNWVIASLIFLMGVTIRHWFNTKHARAGNPHWTWGVTAVLFLIVAWLSTAPMRGPAPQEGAALPAAAARLAAAPEFPAITDIVLGRCSMCHAAEPNWEGLYWAPKGVLLETPEQIALEARRIYLQSGLSHAMPPGNLSYMDDRERAAIVRWFRGEG
ncbi:MAG TPA: urate hydroxylase PuuD [Paracoccaceae bacterium]|nr:urate hydroxylase PuuD [Paracoccaceae bacterium]HMO72109.1 urate hydroxylase PuuD [Paracoccaceae bacterium]